jgi:HTH-type transcriptional regulator/antitoxin HipB
MRTNRFSGLLDRIPYDPLDRMDSDSYQREAAGRLGQAIRLRRKALSLTQKGLADYAGVGVAFLYDLEKGKASVRLDKVLDVLRILGLEMVIADGKGGIVVSGDEEPTPASGHAGDE